MGTEKAQLCTPPRAAASDGKTSTFHGGVSWEIARGLVTLSRGPSCRRDHIMVLWILKLWSLKTLKKMEKKSFTQNWSSTLDYCY